MSLPANKVSTADFVAAARAWQTMQGSSVFVDPYARDLCGPFLGLALRFRPFKWLLFEFALRGLVPLSLSVLVRARHTEDALERAVDAGIRQYVIIGAGMDSFAFRRPDLTARVISFEIDHPVTQRRKLKRIKRARLTVPPRHHFVEADLTQVSPVEALGRSPFDPSEPALMSLLGVSYYLAPEDLLDTLRSIAAGTPCGTRIIFDYLLDRRSTGSASSKVRDRLLNFVRRLGEPIRGAYSLEDLDELMVEARFRKVENFKMADLTRSYFGRFGPLPFEIPDVFGLCNYEVVAASD